MTPGFVGSDLQALISEAGMNAVKRIIRSSNIKESTTDSYECECYYFYGYDCSYLIVYNFDYISIIERILLCT